MNWQEIREIHKKTTAGAKEGIAFRYFSRPVASFLLYFLKNGKVTPNQITILSLAFGVAGSFAHVFMLDWSGLVIGAALFMLAHMLDALDGQLARLRKAGSVIGMHFDFFIDGVKAFLMYGALSVRLYQQALHPGTGHWILGDARTSASPLWFLRPLLERAGAGGILLIAVLGMIALATGVACTDFIKKKEWKEAFPPAPGARAPGAGWSPVALIEKFGKFVVDYPSYILILCLLNRVDLYLLGYTAVVILYAGRTLLAIMIKLWRVNPYQKSG